MFRIQLIVVELVDTVSLGLINCRFESYQSYIIYLFNALLI